MNRQQIQKSEVLTGPLILSLLKSSREVSGIHLFGQIDVPREIGVVHHSYGEAETARTRPAETPSPTAKEVTVAQAAVILGYSNRTADLIAKVAKLG